MLEIIKSYTGSIIFIFSVYIFGRIVFEQEKKNIKLKDIIIFIICSLIYSTIIYLLDGTIKTILSCIVFMIMFKLIFNISCGKALIASILYAILSIIPDLLILTVITKILNISKEYCYSTFAGSIFCNIFVGIITLTIVYFFKKKIKKIFNYNIPENKKLLFLSILTILFIVYFFYEFAVAYKTNENIIIYLIAIFGFMIVLFTLYKQKIENESISKKYDDLLKIMKNYENDIEEQRTMIHETRNELMTIKCKINDKEKENAIIEYIDSILGDKVSSKMSKYSKFKYLPSNGIKGFFYYKSMEAEEKGIKVSVNISKKIENSFLGKLNTKDFKDFVRIIGVYLDNAIEASDESKEKKLGIEIYLINEDIEIIISNTFENRINSEKIGKERFTTKGKKHGHGLLLVNHILKNNLIFKSNNQITNNLYIQKLKIKKELI